MMGRNAPIGTRRAGNPPLPLSAIPVGFILGYLVATILVGAWVARFDSGLGARLVSSVGLWFGFIGVPLAVSRAQWSSLDGDYGLRVGRRVNMAIALPLGMALQVVVIPSLYWIIERMSSPLDVESAARGLTRGASGVSWLAVIAVVAIGAPIAEEIFFRGLVLRSIEQRWGVGRAILLSSAIFAGSHFQLVQFPGLFVAGLAFAVVAVHTRRLGPAILCHAAFNLTGLIAVMVANTST